MKVISLLDIIKLSTHFLLEAIHIVNYLVTFKTTLINLAGKHVNLTNYTRTRMYTMHTRCKTREKLATRWH